VAELPGTERAAALHEPARERLDERQLRIVERQGRRATLPDRAEGGGVARLLRHPKLLQAMLEGGQLGERALDGRARRRVEVEVVGGCPRRVEGDGELESSLAACRRREERPVAALVGRARGPARAGSRGSGERVEQ